MKWEQIFDKAVNQEKHLKVHLYADSMFSVSLDDLAEADLTESEAKDWLWKALSQKKKAPDADKP